MLPSSPGCLGCVWASESPRVMGLSSIFARACELHPGCCVVLFPFYLLLQGLTPRQSYNSKSSCLTRLTVLFVSWGVGGRTSHEYRGRGYMCKLQTPPDSIPWCLQPMCKLLKGGLPWLQFAFCGLLLAELALESSV